MTNVKNEKFHAKIIKISYFELQKSCIPQKKSENMYNKGSARKSNISCKKIYFLQFFSIFATYLRTPRIFNAQFSESSEKKIPKMILLQPSKYQKEQSHEFWSAQPQPCGNGRRIYVAVGTKCPTPSGIGLKLLLPLKASSQSKIQIFSRWHGTFGFWYDCNGCSFEWTPIFFRSS